MAKEFDIYLRKHLVECDLLVYSTPYHDGISVTNRLILETALNGYLLHKFAAAQMGSEVEAHIDQMIKLCLEKLSMGMDLGAVVDFEAHAKLYIENDPIIIDTPAINMLGQVFNEVESGLILAVDSLVTQVASSTGRGDFPLLVDAGVTDTLKYSLLNLRSALTPDVAVRQINQVDYIRADTSTVIDSTLQSLCYNLVFDASAATEIMALVLGTEIRHSLGVWYNGLTFASKVTGTWTQKFIVAETVTAIMQEAMGKLIKVLYPDDGSTVVKAADLNISMKRYRLLHELDDLCLADIDNMTLEELDYVWLT